MTNCGNPKCNHPQENHVKSICDGAIDCMCEEFIVPELAAFAAEVEVHKAKRWGLHERCKYILEKIPPSRNAGEGSFPKIYLEIWHGVKIRAKIADCTIINTKLDKELPLKDSINREKRRVKQLNPSLRTYSAKVLLHQSAIWEALMEMSAEV